MLSFELDSPITLADSIFDANASDSTKMIPLNRDAMCQLLKIEAKVYNKDIRNIYNDTIVYDSSFHDVIYFFIYGKLYLQPDVKSIVVWKFKKNKFYLDGYPEDDYLEKSFWLFNLKENTLRSVARLDILYGWFPDTPYNSDKIYFKNGIFTVRRTKYRLPFWADFRVNPAKSLKERITGVDEYYTYYSVDKDGFIKFVED
ncbi:hypothetical protein AGMMS50239_33020 [Bacteroidia bacterium]|nr:hypothetical protein AGMMS50239_33020 [Bacteroidia bacterium]